MLGNGNESIQRHEDERQNRLKLQQLLLARLNDPGPRNRNREALRSTNAYRQRSFRYSTLQAHNVSLLTTCMGLLKKKNCTHHLLE